MLVGGISRRAAGGRLGRNAFAGIRTKRSMADDESWLTVHRGALPWTYASSAALIIAGAVVIAARTETVLAVAGLTGSALCLIFMFAGVAAGHRALGRRGPR